MPERDQRPLLPLWATVMSVLVWGHLPDRWTIAGATLVIAGGMYALWRERRAAQQVHPEDRSAAA